MEIIPLPRPRAVSGSCEGQFDILISPVILLGYVVLSKNSATYVPPEFLFFLELLMMTHHCFVCLELSAVAKSLFLPGAVPVPSTPSVHTLLYLPPVKSERLLVRVGCKRTRIFTHTLRRCPHGLREAWEYHHETIGNSSTRVESGRFAFAYFLMRFSGLFSVYLYIVKSQHEEKWFAILLRSFWYFVKCQISIDKK